MVILNYPQLHFYSACVTSGKYCEYNGSGRRRVQYRNENIGQVYANIRILLPVLCCGLSDDEQN